MNVSDIPQLAKMTVPEKIVFLEDLWDSIAEQEQAVPVPDSHIRELERRLAEYRAKPGELLTLEELQQKIASRT